MTGWSPTPWDPDQRPIQGPPTPRKPKEELALELKIQDQLDILLARKLAEERYAELVRQRDGEDEPRILLTPDEIRAFEEKQWVIEGRLPLAPMLVYTYGQPESGKSLVSLADAHAISCGFDSSFGFRVARRLPVVYIDTEGSFDFKERMEALEKYTGRKFEAGFFRVISEQSVAMASRTDIDKLIKEIRAVFPSGAVVVYVDTQAGVTEGVNENSAQDMSAVIANFIRIAKEFSGPVVVVHHSDKTGTDLRGSSAMRGRARLVQFVDKGRVICEKLNGAPHFSPFRFDIESVGSGVCAVTEKPVSVEDAKKKQFFEVMHAVYKWTLVSFENNERFTATEMALQVSNSVPSVSRNQARKAIKDLMEAEVLTTVPGSFLDSRGRTVATECVIPSPFVAKKWEEYQSKCVDYE